MWIVGQGAQHVLGPGEAHGRAAAVSSAVHGGQHGPVDCVSGTEGALPRWASLRAGGGGKGWGMLRPIWGQPEG